MFDLHQNMVTNEHQYVTKIALSASMGSLKGDFIVIFWTIKYLQMSIYIWNKVSKHIMSQCGMDFQQFEPIQYANGLFKSLPIFQVNDPKVTINFDDFSCLLESMVQQPSI